MNRADIVNQAALWEGTPFQHQQSMREVAVDCLGLIRGVYRELTGVEMFPVINYPQSIRYFCLYLYPALQDKMIEIENGEPGDVLSFSLRDRLQDHHLGIILSDDFFIHVSTDFGIKKTIVTRLDDVWRSRVRHAFRFPGVS